MLSIDSHPLLEVGILFATWDAPIGAVGSPEWLQALLSLDADIPLIRDDAIKAQVRGLLRHGGYKPAGRGKPASEYLVGAATKGKLGTINLPVDACNVVSLHSGLPISVVDLERASEPLRVGIAAEGASYVFNASGQEIKLAGLLCLHDAEGPCANGVKDSQRTKTHDGTRRTLSVVWGTRAAPGRTQQAVDVYGALLERTGAAVTTSVVLASAAA